MANTHCHNHNEPIIEPVRCSSCKSDIRMNKDPPASELKDAVNKFVERRGDLTHRQQYLKDKVATLERSVPALMAFNMWMSGQNCEDAPLCKIREIMNKFSPYPDPTEKLLKDLKNTVEDLNRETAELHEKIITADVDLEESGMELESLELSNEEMGNHLKTLEKEVNKKGFSLHSIHSEDVVCLTRIRQLGEEERSMKCCIRQLEEKEMFYRKQMECLLTSKEFQNTMGANQLNKRLKKLETSDKKCRCTYQTQKHNMQKNWTSWNKNQNNPFSGERPNCPPRSCLPSAAKVQNSEKKSCSCSAVSHLYPKKNLVQGKTKFCDDNPLCQSPPGDKSSVSCPPIKSPFGKIQTAGRSSSSNPICKNCPPPKKQGCRCSCKAKCARGKSEIPCNCGSELQSNYQPQPKNINIQNVEEVSSDDEFRECDCGCNSEDDPGNCLCK